MAENKIIINLATLTEKKILKMLGQCDEDLSFQTNIILNHFISRTKNIDTLAKINELEKLLFFDPLNPVLFLLLGSLNTIAGNLEKARSYLSVSLHLNPNCVDTYLELGILYRSINNVYSVRFLEKGLEIDPENINIYITLGVLYVETNQFEKALELFNKALNKNTIDNDTKVKVLGNLSTLNSAMGDNLKALYYCNEIEKIELNHDHFLTKLLTLNNLYPEETEYYTLENIYKEHLKINSLFHKQCIYNKNTTKKDKIRIGYVSSDFKNHVIMKFMYNILKYHDRNKFEIYCYGNMKINQGDILTQFVLNNSIFKSIYNIDTINAALLIRNDDIDILFDLNGNTAGSRLDVFSQKPSKIQVSYLGYPNTTGLEEIDYRITDYIADPVDTKQLYIEKLIRLENCFLSYSWQIDNIDISCVEPVNNQNDFIVFGCINRPSKNSNKYLECVKKILEFVPQSKILIKLNTLETISIEEYKNKFLEKLDVTEDRLIIKNYASSQLEYYELYNDIDILLDTFPYSGTTTTCDSLLMSTPVVTMKGDVHSHNVSSSIIGRMEELKDALISNSYEDYISKAVSIANKETIKYYKSNIRKFFMKSMSHEIFINEYENKLVEIYNSNID